MALTPYPVEQFGGLRLDLDPLEVGAVAAIDLADVDFDRQGRLRSRDGYNQIVALTMDDVQGFAVRDTSIHHQFLVGYTTGGTSTVAAYSSTGGAAIASVNPSNGFISAQMAGSSAALYIANGNGADTIRKWSGSAFSSPGGMPKAVALTLSARSFRLVAAGTDANANRVQWSNAGDPETWGANNFVDLSPGVGFITNAVTWQDLVFVFKDQGAFFVFTAESTDADGEPLFNYYAVAGYGAWDAVAGDEGVYFCDGSTIWLTTGAAPTRVSRAVEPFLRGLVSVNGVTVDQDDVLQWQLSYSLGRLYVSMTTSSGSRQTLVFDPKIDQWTLYSLPINFARTLRLSTFEPQTFWLSDTGAEVFDGSTTDDGAAIDWYSTSGLYDMGTPGQVKVTLESKLVGTGTATLKVATYDAAAASSGVMDTGSALTLGTSPVPAEAWQQIDREGTMFQHQISGTSAATVNRLVHYLRSVKPSGVG